MAVNLAQRVADLREAAQDASALKQVFQAIDVDSCPYSFNFHMHTVCSDGKLQPEALMEQAIAIGLKGFAITDHHTVAGYEAAQRWLGAWKQEYPDLTTPTLWTGVEINADLLNTEVHILGYAFNPQHFALVPYLLRHGSIGEDYQAARVIAALHEAGGLAVLAHPARYKRSPADLIPEASRLGIDGIETYYAYNNPSPWRPSPQETQLMSRLGADYNLLNTCGTDTHGLSLLQRL